MGELAIPDQLPSIYPILFPNLDWRSFLRETREKTGERLSEELDVYGMKLGQDQSIVSAFSTFRFGVEIDPFTKVRKAGVVLDLLHFVFLVVDQVDALGTVLESTNLRGIRHHQTKECWLVGGTLSQWRSAIVEISRRECAYSARLLMNSFLVLFQCNGYALVWDDYERVTLPDQTIELRLK